MIVDRRELRDELARLLALLTRQPAPTPERCSPRRPCAAGPHRRRPFRVRMPMTRPRRLPTGSRYLETLHPKPIAMGLERVARRGAHGRRSRRVPDRSPSPAPTARARRARCSNRSCAHAGYRVGAVHVAAPAALQRARPHRRRRSRPMTRSSRRSTRSRRAHAARQSPLTYFEFSTLAALRLFAARALDALDPRGRPRRPARRGEHRRRRRRRRHERSTSTTSTISARRARRSAARRRASSAPAARRSAATRSAGVAGRARATRSARRCGASAATSRSWRRACSGATRSGAARATALPFPALRGAYQLGNAATALAALDALRDRAAGGGERDPRTDWCMSSCRAGSRCCPDARRWCSTSRTTRMRRACSRDTSARWRFIRATLAVFGMLADKDIDGVVAALRPRIDAGTSRRCPVRAARRRRGSSRRCATPASTRRRFTNSTTSSTHSRRRVTRRRH